MRKELYSLDIHFLLKEAGFLVGSKIDKIYQEGNWFFVGLHSRQEGKIYLKVHLPGLFLVSKEKISIPESKNFAISMRKHISGAIIKGVRQAEFERIIEIEVESQKGRLTLYFEIFKPGNLVLCNRDNKIIMASNYRRFGSRMIRPGIDYEYPKKGFNFLEIEEASLAKMIEKTEKNSVVVALATELGLGGSYAEEICLKAKIDKKSRSLGTDSIKSLLEAIRQIRKRNPEPRIYYDKGQLIDITPFPMETYSSFSEEIAASLNSAWDMHFAAVLNSQKKESGLSKYTLEKKRLEAILRGQELQIKELEEQASDNQKKGETLYEKYEFFREIKDRICDEIKKKGWKGVKERLKAGKIVKKVDEKEDRIVIEL